VPDDKKKRGSGDRDRISADEDYEVADFARQNGISPQQLHNLIKRVGNSRTALIEAAKELREHLSTKGKTNARLP
jgi:hypothetical protein